MPVVYQTIANYTCDRCADVYLDSDWPVGSHQVMVWSQDPNLSNPQGVNVWLCGDCSIELFTFLEPTNV